MHYALLGQEERGKKWRKMVENLGKRKECTSKRKIDALELLGASIALSENAVEGFSREFKQRRFFSDAR